jgi:hypothetical protein
LLTATTAIAKHNSSGKKLSKRITKWGTEPAGKANSTAEAREGNTGDEGKKPAICMAGWKYGDFKSVEGAVSMADGRSRD